MRGAVPSATECPLIRCISEGWRVDQASCLRRLCRPRRKRDVPLLRKWKSRMGLLQLPEVLKKTKCSRTFVLARIAEGSFPAPIKCGVQKRLFIEAEIDAWIDRHAAARTTATEQVSA